MNIDGLNRSGTLGEERKKRMETVCFCEAMVALGACSQSMSWALDWARVHLPAGAKLMSGAEVDHVWLETTNVSWLFWLLSRLAFGVEKKEFVGRLFLLCAQWPDVGKEFPAMQSSLNEGYWYTSHRDTTAFHGLIIGRTRWLSQSDEAVAAVHEAVPSIWAWYQDFVAWEQNEKRSE